MFILSEVVLRIGRRGEIYTTKEVRERISIREGGFVKAFVVDGKLIIKPMLSVEEKIKKYIVELSPEEAERLSEEAELEEGIHR